MSVHREIVYVGAVDGVETGAPRGYALVPSGTHTLTLVHEKCWIPSSKKRCGNPVATADVLVDLEAGVAYRIDGMSSPPRRVEPKRRE